MPIVSEEGIEIPNHITITHLWDGKYKVFNEITNKCYEVDLDLHSCTCPHWEERLKHNKGICKHQDWIKWWGAWNK